MEHMIPIEKIAAKVCLVRKQKVLIDRDLAELYGVQTRVLKQAVRRNMKRFPEDFMFILTKEEFQSWRSQAVMSEADRRGLRHPPMAFTEQGVAMLSSVLKSERAIEVNIAIMRAFVFMRQMLADHEELKQKLEELEAKYDRQFQAVFEAIRQLLTEEEKPKRRIGF